LPDEIKPHFRKGMGSYFIEIDEHWKGFEKEVKKL